MDGWIDSRKEIDSSPLCLSVKVLVLTNLLFVRNFFFRQKASQYALNDKFHADEFGQLYQSAPIWTIEPASPDVEKWESKDSSFWFVPTLISLRSIRLWWLGVLNILYALFLWGLQEEDLITIRILMLGRILNYSLNCFIASTVILGRLPTEKYCSYSEMLLVMGL